LITRRKNRKKTLTSFINHVRGPDKCVRQVGSGPRDVVWKALL